MKPATKIGIVLGLSALAIAIAFLTLPIKQWKKYKENHPSLFEATDEATPKYWDFCLSYWKAFIITGTEKEEDMTFDGGELEEIIVNQKYDTTKPKHRITHHQRIRLSVLCTP